MTKENCYKYFSVFLVFFLCIYFFKGRLAFYMGLIILYFLPHRKLKKKCYVITNTYLESPHGVFTLERSTYIMTSSKKNSRRSRILLDLQRIQDPGS